MMSTDSSPTSPKAPMARAPVCRPLRPTLLADSFVFIAGAFSALLLFWILSSFLSPPPPMTSFSHSPTYTYSSSFSPSLHFTNLSIHPDLFNDTDPDLLRDPPESTFYDDPSLSYTIDRNLSDWDDKRSHWLRLHPWLSPAPGGRERILMISGSQPNPCHNPIGDHLLLRFLKNKIDYCRRHGIELLYNNALQHPKMRTFWAKIPIIRAAMVAHPEADWVWWVDSDAAFTDMDFHLPLRRYRNHNLVLHGWPHLVFQQKSWVGLNAGVFLIRNCQWSLDFMARWARFGPQDPEYEQWGHRLKNEFKDKLFVESDDQSALVHLLNTERDRWAAKVFLEDSFYFEGYWIELVGRFENMTEKYLAMERKVPPLRRRHAEKVAGVYGRMRDGELEREGAETGPTGWRRPFITHFTGCQPCSGDHNKKYSGENCYEGMLRALNFADDQVARVYGFRHTELGGYDVTSLPFDYPAAE
ncbi:Galactomannan galactosyltransferase 1 [Cocos nucifera]|uniref:Galactomannan galactosyltransferase 1 n=1 Tax=Cocos nucifera TaxID=13894 RepID=A0A8K0IV11_COCNU|nr:Galactomannan galactosyltransferase 1 [Cocos nucifera]